MTSPTLLGQRAHAVEIAHVHVDTQLSRPKMIGLFACGWFLLAGSRACGL
jgi:hypothetical protein